MIACGHCQERHETVAEVRTCAGLAPDPFLGNPPRKEPTEKQLNYAQSLLHERVPSGHTADLEIEQGISAAEEYVNSLSFHEMRSWIGTAKSWPMRKQRASSGSKIQVEDGGVACEVGFEDIPDSNGVLYKFQYRSKDSLVAMVTVALDPTQPEAAQVMASIAEGDFSGLFRMAIERHTEIMDETIRNKASQN